MKSNALIKKKIYNNWLTIAINPLKWFTEYKNPLLEKEEETIWYKNYFLASKTRLLGFKFLSIAGKITWNIFSAK